MPDGQVSLGALRRGLCDLTQDAHTAGTRATYNSGVNRFDEFTDHIKHHKIAKRERFLLFIVYLAQICKLSFGTIKVYSAAVRNWFI